MPGPRVVDQKILLDRAVITFWEKGYAATTIDDLVDHMGIQRGQLYSAFGSKQQLFLEVLDRYTEIVVSQIQQVLTQHNSGLVALNTLFEKFVEQISVSGPWCGCLIVNAAIDATLADDFVKEKVNYMLQRIEQAFSDALMVAINNGDVRSDIDIDAMSRYLTASLQGLIVIGKVNKDRQRLNAIVKITLSILTQGEAIQLTKQDKALEKQEPID